MSKIVASASYLPSQVLSNVELVEETGIDSSDEWISQRTGIKQRHLAFEQSLASLASQAGQQAIDKLGQDIKDQINLIIVASMSSRLPTPAIANQVQKNLAIEKSWAFDVSGACAGFVTALELAEKLGRDKQDGYSLVIGAEKMSDILDFQDRSTSILFGDGSGAVLIKNDGQGLPSYSSEICSMIDERNSITVDSTASSSGYIQMAGRDVFNFVVRSVIPSLKDFIQEQVGEFDYLISHQANARLIDIMVKKLKIDPAKAPINIDQVANTSAASIPILLDQLVDSGQIKLNGQNKLVLTGFGGGLTYGHISLKL